MIWFKRQGEKVQVSDGINRARRERELSERRASEAEPLKRSLSELIEENHVSQLIERIIQGRSG